MLNCWLWSLYGRGSQLRLETGSCPPSLERVSNTVEGVADLVVRIVGVLIFVILYKRAIDLALVKLSLVSGV